MPGYALSRVVIVRVSVFVVQVKKRLYSSGIDYPLKAALGQAGHWSGLISMFGLILTKPLSGLISMFGLVLLTTAYQVHLFPNT